MLIFFALTFAVTWASWFAAAAIWHAATSAEPPIAAVRYLVFLFGVFAPAFVALALTAREHGRAAAVSLFNRIFHWQVPLRWYVFAVGFFPAIKLAVAVLYRVMNGAWPRFGNEGWYLMAGAILISTWAQAGEEIGWRGYALPRLAERLGLGGASIVLGVIWASWHLPLFFAPATSTFGQSFPVYLLQVTAISVALAWLYWKTNGSLLLVMVLHAAVNNTKDIVPSALPGVTESAHIFSLASTPVAWLTVLLLWSFAAYFLFSMRNVRTVYDEKRQYQGEARAVR